MTTSFTQSRHLQTPLVSSSPLLVNPHNVAAQLASHCLREAFGPCVQMVADGLVKRGPSTLVQLLAYLQEKLPERKTREARWHTQPIVVDAASLRAAMIVLMQHSLVYVTSSTMGQSAKRARSVSTFRLNVERARWLQHYPRYIDHVRKSMDEACASMMRTALLHGRLKTLDLLVQVMMTGEKNGTSQGEHRKTAVDTMYRLVKAGLLERASPLNANGSEDEEYEFEEEKEPPSKKAKTQDSLDMHFANDNQQELHAIIQGNTQYRTVLDPTVVWRVNHAFLHASLRALTLGRLVAELYGHKVTSAGSMVTAALKLRAHRELIQAKQDSLAETASDLSSFAPDEIVPYLPKTVLASLESKQGGVTLNLINSWHELSLVNTPVQVVSKVGENRYEILVSRLLDYLKERIMLQIIQDRYGIVAARIVNILRHKGWLESEALAEHVMIPAKETREHLHSLYRCRYIDLFPLPTTRQHNTATCIYVWQVNWDRLLKRIRENVTTALWNMRLRRQHLTEVGRGWIERAQNAEEIDENENETDKVNYQKFCQGLERLDSAIHSLDESSMILEDF
jgi:hypothetical protein